jgi:hypothetical protein
VIKRAGRFYGDGNAPDVLHFIYRDFYENKKPATCCTPAVGPGAGTPRTSRRWAAAITKTRR